ncbi:hypothetical protein HDV01_005997 [Terramyces sp. JEL0728]|nr:hypothetical protein HDV01_005997 [Terramyces sp. JEL0728]
MATKDDWAFLIEQEEGELFVLQLIEDIISESQKVLFKKHIDVQLLPYAVNFAKESILSMINYHFFTRDPGDNDPSLWIPDTDSWARAAIPIKPLASHYARTTDKNAESNVKEIILPTNKTKTTETKKKSKPEISPAKSLVAPKLKPHPPKDKPAARFSEYKPPRTTESALSEVERAIADENRRLMARINEKDDGKVNVTFDQVGRLLIANNVSNWNGNSGVKIKVLGSEKTKEDVREPQASVVKRGIVRKQKQKQKAVVLAQPNVELNDGFQEDATLNIPLLKETTTHPEYPLISKEKEMFQSTQIAVLEEIINNSKPLPAQNSVVLLDKGL